MTFSSGFRELQSGFSPDNVSVAFFFVSTILDQMWEPYGMMTSLLLITRRDYSSGLLIVVTPA
ncbi:MAG: hypothetical protein ACKOBV_05865 [Candidatus Kapaibacterium sp.]